MRGVSKLMPYAFHIPGNKHILHNLSKDALGVLKCWKQLRDEMLKPVVDLLHYEPWRERLVATCFKDTGLEALFSTFPHTLSDWVWDEIAECLEQLHIVAGALRSHWDLKKFCFAGVESIKNASVQQVFKRADTAIRTPFFWTYCEMLRVLLGLVRGMSLSQSGCQCHEDDVTLHSELKKHRLLSALGLRSSLSGLLPLPVVGSSGAQQHRIHHARPIRSC